MVEVVTEEVEGEDGEEGEEEGEAVLGEIYHLQQQPRQPGEMLVGTWVRTR